jgi:hypothetical protein
MAARAVLAARPKTSPSEALVNLEVRTMIFSKVQKPVGAGLPAIAVGQPPLMSNVLPSSRASPLPQGDGVPQVLFWAIKGNT